MMIEDMIHRWIENICWLFYFKNRLALGSSLRLGVCASISKRAESASNESSLANAKQKKSASTQALFQSEIFNLIGRVS
jgi:hypothetical protein